MHLRNAMQLIGLRRSGGAAQAAAGWLLARLLAGRAGASCGGLHARTSISVAPMPNLLYRTVSPPVSVNLCCLVPTWPSPTATTSPLVGRVCRWLGQRSGSRGESGGGKGAVPWCVAPAAAWGRHTAATCRGNLQRRDLHTHSRHECKHAAHAQPP